MSYIFVVKQNVLMANSDKPGKKLLGDDMACRKPLLYFSHTKTSSRKNGLDKPSNVIIQGLPEGILIKKVEL